MKFIFLTIPAYGHLNAMLGVAKKLIDTGHKVIFYNTEDFKGQIEKVGAVFRRLPIDNKLIDLRVLHSALNIAEQSLIFTKILTAPLVKSIHEERPDCLIHDSLCVWGKLSGIITHTPTISLVSNMTINANMMFGYAKYLLRDLVFLARHLLKTMSIVIQYLLIYIKVSLPPPFIIDLLSNKEKLNIVFTSEYFQPKRTSFDASYKFVGPIIYHREENSIPLHLLNTKKPIIYIALGTVYNDNLAMYQCLTQMFKNTPYQVFISIGKYINRDALGKIPDNVYIDKYLPQLELLKKASLFISHAGMNSVNESLYFGVPMLMLPHIQEQRINADRVEELGAGICYSKKDIDENELMQYIKKITENPFYKKGADKISKTLIQAGGAERAVKHIYDFLKYKT